MLRSSFLFKLSSALLAALLALLLLFLIFRPTLLSTFSQRYIQRYEKEHHCTLSVSTLTFEGLQTVAISNLHLAGDSAASLIDIADLKVSIRLLPLMFGKISVKKLEVKGLRLNIMLKDSTNNYSFLLKSAPTDNSVHERDFSSKADHLLGRLFGKIPASLVLENALISISKDSIASKMEIKKLSYSSQKFEASIESSQHNSVSGFTVSGLVKAGERSLDLQLRSNTSDCQLPFLNDFLGLKLGFKELDFSLGDNESEHGILSLSGRAASKDLVLNHWRIAESDVRLNSGELNYRINIGKDYLELDTTSQLRYNRLSFSPYLRYRSSTSKQFCLKIDKPQMNADDFFSSLPIGLFKNLEGLKASGQLGFHFLFDVDFNQPDSLHYECLLSSKQFALERQTTSGLAKMNSEFIYTAYEKGQAVKSFPVGPSCPDFVPAAAVSDYLKNSILIAEDPDFFHHRGFSTDAFRESIIKNIKEKRFARGGSTLSMQLVKNVFLNRNKNISRKIEEALLVWLIENNHITSKDRMFEVYLNIIEWGPRVYGAEAASEFYFSKQASNLNLAESIFLAYLIPHPKYFASAFEASGHLKPYMAEYYRLLSSKLARKNMVTAADTLHLQADVQLKGIAKSYLKKPSLQSDSIPTYESDF